MARPAARGRRHAFWTLVAGCSLALVPACAAPPAMIETATPTNVVVATAAAAPTATPLPAHISADPDATVHPAARAVRGGPPVRGAPDTGAATISGLYFDASLPLLEERTAADGSRWYRVRLWGVLDGWIQAEHVTRETPDSARPFYETETPNKRPTAFAAPLRTLDAVGATNWEVTRRAGPGTQFEGLGSMPPGTPLRVRGWATDAAGHAWYEAESGDRLFWVYAATVDLAFADPLRPVVAGKPLASLVTGKGMWLPQPLLEMADERQVVEAAERLGLSHIFVEVGESAGGFYGRKELARLLPVAHAADLKVIAWVTTGLWDLMRDVELSVEIATFQTADGHSPDGIAPDIEQNMHADDIKAYAEVTRVRLGDDKLIMGVVYTAGGWFGREYPIYATLARAVNALAPMAYWNDKEREYTYREVYDYVFQAVLDMRAAAGGDFPVHLIGQMYDTFGRNGTGRYSPRREEVRAALQAALDAGAVGASFFQWGTATPEEWAALRDFNW